ncbi:Asp-tRNA(Asn)/Glu-tRNA(Gln) amidotransferase subunit GatC [Cerasicoccus maritimus]|uniref:Asp-tRNA(Asn)/Glu-tRNA(Gln) amidotransferase subunit GatC n=1 Tax=Cerasicoccus maritimus TaxID=490089 RepID=UPI00285269E9|nr:Asp-tRNA(Asn)/Glu-tRNA(Gln) amidotransferase subunit GatC [Cerasicoccus maritimus]
MAHTEIDIDKVAKLARLDLTDEEKQTYSAQLGQVLEHMEKLNALDLDDVEPTAHSFPLSNVLDEDVDEPGFTPEEALRNAPAQRENQVVVPKVVE